MEDLFTYGEINNMIIPEPKICEHCNQPIDNVKKHYTECVLSHLNAVIRAKNKKKKKS